MVRYSFGNYESNFIDEKPKKVDIEHDFSDNLSSGGIDLINNDYDPLLITSEEVQLISPGVWKKSITLAQDQNLWSFSLDNLFSISDDYSDLEVINLEIFHHGFNSHLNRIVLYQKF